MDFADLYREQEPVCTMAKLVSSRVEAFVHRLLGISTYKCSDGRYPGFSSEIVSCHFPLTDAHVEHINRVVVGHLMLRCGHLAYFANRLDPTLAGDQRQAFDLQLQDLGRLFRGECIPLGVSLPLKQPLVFALAIVHDIGKTAFLADAGHEERAGPLVSSILERLTSPLGLSEQDVILGRRLIENHTMLGTLVQAERSAKEVLQYLRASFDGSSERQQIFLSYLLLLNSMDLSGFRYLPIILDPYWTARYIEFSSIRVLENYARNPKEFALYRLRQLARSRISDHGDIDVTEVFHRACAEEFDRLSPESKEAIGTVRIRDALYLIIDFNDAAAAGESGRFSTSHAATYVGFLKALADIAIYTRAHTIAFRGDGSRTAERARLSKLVTRLRECNRVVQPPSFSNHDGVTEFTIGADGSIVPVKESPAEKSGATGLGEDDAR